MILYFWDKPFTWLTISEDLMHPRLYVGLLVAILAVLAIEALAFRTIHLIRLPWFIIVMRWMVFLLGMMVYWVVN